jgi:hypothetical protein
MAENGGISVTFQEIDFYFLFATKFRGTENYRPRLSRVPDRIAGVPS